MREDRESTPFLRGQAAGGEGYGAAGTSQQSAPQDGHQDGPGDVFVFAREQKPALFSRAGLRVLAVRAATLVIVGGLISTWA